MYLCIYLKSSISIFSIKSVAKELNKTGKSSYLYIIYISFIKRKNQSVSKLSIVYSMIDGKKYYKVGKGQKEQEKRGSVILNILVKYLLVTS